MPFSLVPTPALELIIEESDHPHADKAVEELRKLRDINCHLLTHFVAIKQQTEASTAGLQSLVREIEPEAPPHLSGRLLE